VPERAGEYLIPMPSEPIDQALPPQGQREQDFATVAFNRFAVNQRFTGQPVR
jgi:hypothetical protein